MTDMINGMRAISSLTSVASSGSSALQGQQPAGVSFEQVLGRLFDSGVKTLQAGESAAIAALEGAAPPFKAVDAIMTAQRTLQAALAIRDKAVAAYQEVARMSI